MEPENTKDKHVKVVLKQQCSWASHGKGKW